MIPADSPLVAALSPFHPDETLQSTVVTYGFAPESPPGRDGEGEGLLAWSAPEMQLVRDTFAYISSLVNISFQEVASGAMTIEFEKVANIEGSFVGYSVPTGPGTSIITIQADYIDPIAYGDDNVTVIHEIGHSIGLSHPFDGPNRLPGVINDDDPGAFGLNSELTTRMAYTAGNDPAYPDMDIYGEPATFGAIDIAALQLLYTANTQTGLGNSSYVATPELITIWDNGGTDMIDFSTAQDNAVIDLRAATLEVETGGGGFLSFIARDGGQYADGGYTIAFGVEIENGFTGAGNDRLTGNALDNLLSGGTGNDVFEGGGGNDLLLGGDGLDTARYTADQRSYTLTLSAESTTLEDRRADGDGTDSLAEIEALTFGDSAIAPFDLTKFAGTQNLSAAQMESFIELYIAYFNRAPDAVGLNFWGTAFATGTSLEEMATLFADQPETRATYGENLGNAEFATEVYGNVLGRVADQAGFDFWVGVLDSGARSRDQFILSVLEGAKAAPPPDASNEFIAQVLADQQFLSTKTAIGTYFAVTKGMSDVAEAKVAMGLFTGSAGSISNAVSAIDDFHLGALDPSNGDFLMPLIGVLDDPFGSAVV